MKLLIIARLTGYDPIQLEEVCRRFGEYYSTLNMEAAYSSETPVKTYQATWRHTPEGNIIHCHRCKIVRPHI
jgi:hypothetical protein